MLRKFLLTTCCFSSLSIAGTMGKVCVPDNVTVPCAEKAWDVGIYALYFKPSLSNNVNTAASNSSLDEVIVNGEQIYTNSTVVHGFDFPWKWGFLLEGSYHFNTGNDLMLEWTHYRNQSDNNYSNNMAGGGSLSIVEGQGTLYLNPKHELDQVFAELGQIVDYGKSKKIRYHAGFVYLNYKYTIQGNGLVAFPADETFSFNFTTSKTDSIKYSGFGPRIGADLYYQVGSSFSIYGKGALALLIGTSTVSINDSIVYTRTTTGSLHNSNYAKTNFHWVPTFELKTGVNYKKPLSSGILTLDVGWNWSAYIHLVGNAQTLLFDEIQFLNSTTFVFSSLLDSGDFYLQGPYVGLNWKG